MNPTSTLPSETLVFHLDQEQSEQPQQPIIHANDQGEKNNAYIYKEQKQDMDSTSISDKLSPEEDEENQHNQALPHPQPQSSALPLNVIKINPVPMDDQLGVQQPHKIRRRDRIQLVLQSDRLNRDVFREIKVDKTTRQQQFNKFEDQKQSSIHFARSEISPPLSSMRKLMRQTHQDNTDELPVFNLDTPDSPSSPCRPNNISKLVQKDIGPRMQEEEQWQSEEQEQQEYEQLQQVTPRSKEYGKLGAKPSQIKAGSLIELVGQDVPRSKTIKCYIKVITNGLLSLDNTYEMYLVEDKKLVLTATKYAYGITESKFLIQTPHKNRQDASTFIAEAVSNFTRTQYVLRQKKYTLKYPKGQKVLQDIADSHAIIIAPKDDPTTIEIQKVQDYEAAFISFKSNLFGFRQQEVNFLRRRKQKKLRQTDRFSALKNAYEDAELERLQIFSAKRAEVNKLGQYVLDFKGEELEGSSKNMMLEDSQGEVVMLFGKKKKGLYVLNIQHPLNLLQSFFLSLSLLDKKPLVQ